MVLLRCFLILLLESLLISPYLLHRQDDSPDVVVIESAIVVSSADNNVVTVTSISTAGSLGSGATTITSTTSSTAAPAAPSASGDGSDNCGLGSVNTANWVQKGVDAWFTGYGESHANGQNLIDDLRRNFAPNVAKSAFDCDVSNGCSACSALHRIVKVLSS